MTSVFLDFNSSTPCDQKVIDSMNQYWKIPGNPHSSVHAFGWNKNNVIEEARSSIANLLNVFTEDLFFTSGATESNNIAILSGLRTAARSSPSKFIVVTTWLEHPSVIEPLKIICNEFNLKLHFVSLNKEGFINVEELRQLFSSGNVLWFSSCNVSGEIGTVQDIELLGKLCLEFDVIFHVDATQGTYEQMKPLDYNVDFMSMSAHKIYGPTGIGLLYVRNFEESGVEPLFYGGGQQNGLRPGTIPSPLVVGYGRAFELLYENISREIEYLTSLRNYLFTSLQNQFPVILNGSTSKRHPGNLHVQIKGVDALTLLNNVQPNLAFSLGSACSSGQIRISNALKAIGLTDEQAFSSFRISCGRFTTKEQIDQAIKILHRAYCKLI